MSTGLFLERQLNESEQRCNVVVRLHQPKLSFVAARKAEDDEAKRGKDENCNKLREWEK